MSAFFDGAEGGAYAATGFVQGPAAAVVSWSAHRLFCSRSR
ncbi:hypothetical protein FHS85_004148 [Rhodoligotrophos appendicifer]|nr:hypothetical protein [Rhodoligotrophos appendicifer]